MVNQCLELDAMNLQWTIINAWVFLLALPLISQEMPDHIQTSHFQFINVKEDPAEVLGQYSGIERLWLTSHENTKITTNSWTFIHKGKLEPTKILYFQRQRRSHNKMVGSVHSWYNQTPYPMGGQPTNWKIIISQRFSHRSKSSEPLVRLSSLRVSCWEMESPEYLALKGNESG